MQVLEWLLVVAVLGSGVVAGIFFTFSNFVMPALARLPERQGVEAMQQINITVINPGAMGAMFGTALIHVAVVVLGLLYAEGLAIGLSVAGAALYIIGCVGVTVAGNVPLNERLAKLDAASEQAAVDWRNYLKRWTFFNTLRTVASALACVVYTVLLVVG